MTTAADIIRVAQGQVGYVESGGPHGNDGNITRYWQALDPSLQGAPWCAGFVSWVFRQAGHPLPAIDHPWGYSYCPDAVTYARHAGLWDESGHYSPGDVILYEFEGSVADHTGLVVSDDGTTIHTVEGNTSPGDSGSQQNGGGVYARVRSHGPQVLGVLAMSRVLGGAPAPAPRGKANPYPVPARTLSQGASGDDVRYVQWAVGVPCDGAFGPQTAAAVRSFQSHHPACQGVDGVVGPHTLAVLKGVTH